MRDKEYLMDLWCYQTLEVTLGNFGEVSLVCWAQKGIGLKGWLSCISGRGQGTCGLAQ